MPMIQNATAMQSVPSAPRPMVMHARVVTSTGGGPDKTILNSPRFLAEMGYDCLCTFLHPPEDDGFDVLRSRAIRWRAPVAEIADRGKLDWRAIRQAVRLCRERQVRIWHAHDYKTNLIGLIARRYHRMKLVTTAHGWVNFAGVTPVYYWLDKHWWLRRYDRIICVSDSVLNECRRAGVPESKCVVIENAIDEEQFRRTRSVEAAKREMWDAGESQLVIGAIGRLAEEKGFDRLIEAFVHLLDTGVDARLVIAGEGPEEAALKEQIAMTGRGNQIALVGFCQDTRRFLESLDLFVLSSLREGLPNVVLEAMAMGVPVVATDVGSVRRLIQNGYNGLLIEPGNVQAIQFAMNELAGSRRQRMRYAEAAVETIVQNWSFRRRMYRISEVYRELLAAENC